MILQTLLIFACAVFSDARTIPQYSGIDFTDVDYDQSLQVTSMSLDEVGNSIGKQYGFASDIYDDWIAGGTGSNTFVILYKYNSSDLFNREQTITGQGGIALRMANNTLVIGGHATNTYIFENQNDTWTEINALPISTNCADLNYKSCSTIDMTDDSEYMILGNPLDSSNKGRVRIYNRVGGSWSNTPTYTQFPGSSGSRYGDAVCISNNGNFSAACMSGPNGNGSPNNIDRCDIYKRDESTWVLYDTLYKNADDADPDHITTDSDDAEYGLSCAFNDNGDTLFVSHGVLSYPRIYVYDRSESTETFELSQTIEQPGNGNFFGFRLRFRDERLMVSHPLENTVTTPGTNSGGKIHFFYHNNVEWVPQDIVLSATSPTSGDRCGFSAGIYGSTVVAGCRYWDEISPDLSDATVAGRLVTFEDIPPFPTAAPTQSPTTAAPTPDPYVEVGKAYINYNVQSASKRASITKNTIEDVKAKASDAFNIIFSVKTTETSAVSTQFFNNVGNETLFKEKFAAARGCNPGECLVTVDTGARRLMAGTSRDLQQEYTVEIEFTFSEADYNSFTDLNTTIGDPAFIAALATELGVAEEDIDITAVGGTITLEVTLTATVTDEPSGEDSLTELQEVQNSLNNATTILVEQLGDPEDGVQTVTLDLCGTRDCNGFGDSSADNTDSNGCNTNTGVCVCTLESQRWGINCESECECFNGGVCKNNMCHCQYPFYGLKCGQNKTLDCNACGL